MSDDTNAQGTPSQGGSVPGQPESAGAPGPSWTPPPSSTPPPPAPTQQVPTDGPQSYPPAPGAAVSDQTGGTTQRVRSGPNINLSPALILGIVAIVGVVLGLLLKVAPSPESGGDGVTKVKLWDAMGWTWAVLAIAAAVLTLLPALRSIANLSEKQAWTVAAIAAGGLVFWWVLFILPRIAWNTSFLATIGVAAGVGAVWLTKTEAEAAVS